MVIATFRAKTQPVKAQTVFTKRLEALDRKKRPTLEERTLSGLLAKLIEDYDNKHYPMPDLPGHKMVKYLMEQRGLRRTDLVPVLGSRAQVSDLVNREHGTRCFPIRSPRSTIARLSLSTESECRVALILRATPLLGTAPKKKRR
jgi:antitoxin component HigA of HigAB toxin-antitoxin module